MPEDEVQIAYSVKDLLDRLDKKFDLLATNVNSQFSGAIERITSLEHWREEVERQKAEQDRQKAHRLLTWPNFSAAVLAATGVAAIIISLVHP